MSAWDAVVESAIETEPEMVSELAAETGPTELANAVEEVEESVAAPVHQAPVEQRVTAAVEEPLLMAEPEVEEAPAAVEAQAETAEDLEAVPTDAAEPVETAEAAEIEADAFDVGRV